MLSIEYPNEGLYTGGKARYTRRDPETGAVTYARFATPAEELTFLQIEAMNKLAKALTDRGIEPPVTTELTPETPAVAYGDNEGNGDHACECGNGLTGGQCFHP
jgi:hypothetical protein